jgi:hypothetical protein
MMEKHQGNDRCNLMQILQLSFFTQNQEYPDENKTIYPLDYSSFFSIRSLVVMVSDDFHLLWPS